MEDVSLELQEDQVEALQRHGEIVAVGHHQRLGEVTIRVEIGEPQNVCGLCGMRRAYPPNTACGSCA